MNEPKIDFWYLLMAHHCARVCSVVSVSLHVPLHSHGPLDWTKVSNDAV